MDYQIFFGMGLHSRAELRCNSGALAREARLQNTMGK